MLIVETGKGVVIVDRIEDFEDIIEDRGIYEGVETFLREVETSLREGEDNLRNRLENVGSELESYEESLNEQSSVMTDIHNSCLTMLDELSEGKRMNRQKITDLLKNICYDIDNTF